MNFRRFSAVLAAAGTVIALSACGGGAGHGAPLPATSGSAQSSTRGSETFTFDVPKDTGSAHSRHPQYISPATQYMLADVQTGCPGSCAEVTGYPQTVGLTPTSTGCTSSLAGTNCTLTLALPPGSYTASFTTQDAAHAALSTAQSVAFTVTAGTTNTIALTLSGIPAGFIAAPLSAGSSSFAVNAVDADHNVIVGVGAPTISVAAKSGIALTLTQPVAASPNVFGASSTVQGTAVVAVTATYANGLTNACALVGAVCSAPFTITANGILLATEQSGVVEFSVPNFVQQATLPISGVAGTAFSLAVNSAGVLLVGNANANNNAQSNVTVYPPPYSGAPSATIPIGATPTGLAVDKSDNLFVAESGVGIIAEYAPPYTGTATARIGLSQARQICIDSNGDLFVFTSYGTLYELAPPYSETPTQLVGSETGITAIAMDAQNNLYEVFDDTSLMVAGPPYTNTSTFIPYQTNDVNSAVFDNGSGTLYGYDDGLPAFFEAKAPGINVIPYGGPYMYAEAMVPNATSLTISP